MSEPRADHGMNKIWEQNLEAGFYQRTRMSFTCLSFDAEGAEDESQLPDNRDLVD